MKNVLLLCTLAISAGVFAQDGAPESSQGSPTVLPTNIVQKGVSATYSDVYCAGWMSPKDVSNTNFVMAGEQSPNTARFIKNDSIFLSGSGWQEGQKVSIVRRAKDPNLYEMYKGQTAEVKKAGLLFFDKGQATVTFVKGNTAVAHIDFSCDGVVPGDLVVPFQERSLSAFHARPYEFKHFVELKGTNKGRIIMSRDFDVYLGEGKKFYINIGANQGVKAGDYLRIYRGYSRDEYDPSDEASLSTLNYEDDQYHEPAVNPKRFNEIPTRSLGEAVVLTTTATSASAMLTYSVEDVHIGDHFEVVPAPAADNGSGN